MSKFSSSTPLPSKILLSHNPDWFDDLVPASDMDMVWVDTWVELDQAFSGYWLSLGRILILRVFGTVNNF